MSKLSEPPHQILKGIAASGGVARGRICVWGDLPAVPRRAIAPEDVMGEPRRLDEAITEVKAQLEQTCRKVEKELGKDEAAIFLAQLMMLGDAHFYAQVERKLTSEYVNVETAIEMALEEFVQVFETSEDPYLRERTDEVWDAGKVIVDGMEGVVHVHPTPEIVQEYMCLEEELRAHKETHQELIDLKSETADGEPVVLQADIGKGADVASALLYKANGVGPYQTEFHFMLCEDFSDEDEQYEIYPQVVAEMDPRPVSIRTLDLGGDKYLSYFPARREANPYLGWRAIRVSLSHPEVLKAQLKAILRAGTAGRVRILFPMIATAWDVRAARMILEETKSELRTSSTAFDPEMPVGAMSEAPSAALLVDLLIHKIHFLSICTNDLIQFTLAVGRSNKKVASTMSRCFQCYCNSRLMRFK